MKRFCYANGRIMELAKARVAPNDLAVLRGYGCFDFLKTVNGQPLGWPEHWRRFVQSAKLLNLKIPLKEREVLAILAKLRLKNKLAKSEDFSIRLLLTGGETGDGVSFGAPQFFILLEDIYQYPPRAFAKGVKLITHEFLRLIPRAKTTNYLESLRLAGEKKKAGALEILFTHQGKILECSTSNFFLVKNPASPSGRAKLITPKESILLGVTRGKVIDLARQAGIEVEEREVKATELATADEAFLTATNKNLMPVVQVDDQLINRGRPGPLTRQLMALFEELLAQH